MQTKRQPLRENNLTQAERDALVLDNLRLAYSFVRKYVYKFRYLHEHGEHNHDLPDDLVQDAIAGLVRAAKHFEPSKGFKFSTYASWWIRHALSDDSRRRKRFVHATPFSVLDSGDDGRNNREQGKCDPEPNEESPYAATIVDALRILPSRERAIVICRFWGSNEDKNMTLDEIGRLFGISKERVRQILRSAISRLRVSTIDPRKV